MKITHFQKKKKIKKQVNNKTLISQRLIPNFDFYRQQLGVEDEKPLTFPQSRSISWSQTSSQSRSDSLVTGTYVSKINIVVTEITSTKIRFIGRRNLHIQDQYRGSRHYLSQDQIHWSQEFTYPRSRSWSQTLPLSRSSPLVTDNSIIKVKIDKSLSYLNY